MGAKKKNHEKWKNHKCSVLLLCFYLPMRKITSINGVVGIKFDN